MSKRDSYREQARHIIQEAWEINGRPDTGDGDETEIELRTLNGLLAIALTEFTAKPVEEGRNNVLGGAMIGLGDVMREIDQRKEKPHVINPGPNQALRCSVDNGYLDPGIQEGRGVCEVCGRVYDLTSGRHLG